MKVLTKELLVQQTGWALLREGKVGQNLELVQEASAYQEFPGTPMTLMGEQVTSRVSVRAFYEGA